MHEAIMAGAEHNMSAVIHIHHDQGSEMVKAYNAVAGHGSVINIQDISSAEPRYASLHLLDDTSKS